jgi:hypothetical protein
LERGGWPKLSGSKNPKTDPLMTVSFMIDMHVEVGTDLPKLVTEVEYLLASTPVEVKAVEVDFLGVTDEPEIYKSRLWDEPGQVIQWNTMTQTNTTNQPVWRAVDEQAPFNQEDLAAIERAMIRAVGGEIG